MEYNEQDLYWRGQVDATLKTISETLVSVKNAHKDLKADNAEKFKKIMERLNHIEDKFSMWTTVVKTGKFIILAIVAILAFKFGDLGGIWAEVFK